MKKAKWLILLAILGIIIFMNTPESNHGRLKNMVYGERQSAFESTENVTRLFFDKRGHLYPNAVIPDSVLLADGAFLKEYFRNETAAFRTVANQVNLKSDRFSDENFEAFQDSLLSQSLNEIHQKISDSAEVFVLIHGFRKPLIFEHGTTSSFADNFVLQSVINSKNKGENHFIEIYWDGLFDYFEFEERGQVQETFTLFESEARDNAVFAGYGIRKIISKLDVSNMNIISHSLGARVVLSCLFNAFDENVTPEMQARPTPPQENIKIGLIAPAVGIQPFEEYFERTTAVDFSQKDNYQFSILYNENDVVLLKKYGMIGPGPTRFGDTSLGCNYENAAFKLKEYFAENYPNSTLNLIEMNVGSTHMAEHYAFSEGFNAFLAKQHLPD